MHTHVFIKAKNYYKVKKKRKVLRKFAKYS